MTGIGLWSLGSAVSFPVWKRIFSVFGANGRHLMAVLFLCNKMRWNSTGFEVSDTQNTEPELVAELKWMFHQNHGFAYLSRWYLIRRRAFSILPHFRHLALLCLFTLNESKYFLYFVEKWIPVSLDDAIFLRFYKRCICYGKSVRPSLRYRVKTRKRSLRRRMRSSLSGSPMSLVFWRQEWLMGGWPCLGIIWVQRGWPLRKQPNFTHFAS